jgi:hypothetical protein
MLPADGSSVANAAVSHDLIKHHIILRMNPEIGGSARTARVGKRSLGRDGRICSSAELVNLRTNRS